MSEPIKVTFNQPFYRAVEELKKRGIVLPDKYYGELQGLHRQLNFSIAGKASLDQLQGALDSLEKAMNEGQTFAKWQKDIRVQDLGLPKHRLDNIFRTNIQAAYNRGHWENFIEHKKTRPYLMYDAINDSRVRPTHLAMDGIIRPVGDSFWDSHYAPNGFRCRCRCISLNERQAQERSKNGQGLNKPISDEMKPDKGFDYNVGTDLTAGVNKAIKDSKANPVLKSTLENKLKNPPDMKIITLEQFTVVQKTVAELAVKNPHWFPEGFNGIHAVESADMFAGYYQGEFYFSITDELVNGFKPAIDLANAFAKANTEITLTFSEEYAIETLWHELMHARTGVTAGRLELGTEPLNEGVVQLAARHTYQEIAKELGINLTHQKKIISNGLAYPVVTRNLLELIKQADISGAEIENLLLSHGNNYLDPFKGLLAEGLNTKRVGTLLNAATILTIDALKEKIKVQQKNAPLQRKE
jgi:SPP1 gp7 family putative phage head morphogenesis protein